MAPRNALNWRETLRSERCGGRLHAEVRVKQDMRRIRQDSLPPAIDRQWALHEPIACSRRHSGFAVLLDSGVITEHPKLRATELANPAFDQDLPDRMPPEEPGDDTHLHRLIRSRRRR